MTGKSRAGQHDDIERVRAEFGVSTEQVLRDEAISHVLAALSRMAEADDLIFFGGTALARTFLPRLRLSEDIDLLTRVRRADMASRIERAVARSLQRTYGPVAWTPSLVEVRDSDAAVLQVGERIGIRVQLLNADRYPAWPTERRELVQRYPNAPAAELTTMTAPAFAANKTATWLDRHAPRDLYDLWALGQEGYIDRAAAALFVRYGPTGRHVQPWMFAEPPGEDAWRNSLGHQGIIRISAKEALAEVREMWRRASPPTEG